MIAVVIAICAVMLAAIAAVTPLVLSLLSAKDAAAAANEKRDLHIRDADGLRAQLKEKDDELAKHKKLAADQAATIEGLEALLVLHAPDHVLRDHINRPIVHPDGGQGGAGARPGGNTAAGEIDLPRPPAAPAPRGPGR